MTGTDNDPIRGPGGRDPSSISTNLLAGLQAQAAEAWRRLARLYAPLVYRWCLRAGLPAEDGEDVVQEVFRTVLVKVGSFRRVRKGDTFRGWLWTITQNKLKDAFRRRQAQPMAAGGTGAYERLLDLTTDEPEAKDGATLSGELAALYRRALDLIHSEFEQKSWDAFWKVVVDERSPHDVAAELGMTLNAVYLAKSRVLRRLREELCEVID